MKWKKPKDSKALQEKSAYGKIKQAEKITNWTNVCYPNKDAVAVRERMGRKENKDVCQALLGEQIQVFS